MCFQIFIGLPNIILPKKTYGHNK